MFNKIPHFFKKHKTGNVITNIVMNKFKSKDELWSNIPISTTLEFMIDQMKFFRQMAVGRISGSQYEIRKDYENIIILTSIVQYQLGEMLFDISIAKDYFKKSIDYPQNSQDFKDLAYSRLVNLVSPTYYPTNEMIILTRSLKSIHKLLICPVTEDIIKDIPGYEEHQYIIKKEDVDIYISFMQSLNFTLLSFPKMTIEKILNYL